MRQLRPEFFAEFAKTADKLEMKAGVIEGTVYDVAGLNELAKIPSREVLLSKIARKLAVTDYKLCSCY